MTILPVLLGLMTATGTAAVHSGTQNQLKVPVPRIEAAVEVDGALDEPVWQQAAVLTDFSQYAPVDGRPADDVTEVLVWYSPAAMHFGIRAHAAAGAVRATLADRDRIEVDDHIQIFLSTFNDGRQALMFGVNPFGVQADGALVEGTRSQGGGFGGLPGARETADLTPDFVYQFATPNRLIYTRRIVAPLTAAKLTGKLAGTTLAVLSAVDDRSASVTGDHHPVFSLARLQRDLGSESRAGLVYTDRVDGPSSSRVVGADARLSSFRSVLCGLGVLR